MKWRGDDILMKKIMLMIIFVVSVVGCELLDPKGWKEAREDMREKGVRCYRKANGNAYCEDKYGNRVY